MICYELWGEDAFSGEKYLCGTYKHYSSAWRAMRKCRLCCMECQSEGLCDTFWIVRKDLIDHVSEADRRHEYVRSIHERMDSDLMMILKYSEELYLFARNTVDGVGVYTFLMPEDSDDSDIESINFLVRRQYRSRTKYELSIYVKFISIGECTGVTADIVCGTMSEIRSRMEKPDISLQYLHMIFDAVRKHYYSRL